MNPYLDEDLVALADQARRFATDRVAPGFQERDRTRVLDRGLMKEMGAMGFIAPELPESYGGLGMGCLAAGVICCYAVHIKFRAGFDDALDVVGVHFVGGLVGSLMIGLFADADYFGAEHMNGLFYGGGLELLAEQALANGVTIVYSGIVTAVILLAIKATIGLRVTEEVEATGLDVAEHAETAYNTGDAFMERAGF